MVSATVSGPPRVLTFQDQGNVSHVFIFFPIRFTRPSAKGGNNKRLGQIDRPVTEAGSVLLLAYPRCRA